MTPEIKKIIHTILVGFAAVFILHNVLETYDSNDVLETYDSNDVLETYDSNDISNLKPPSQVEFELKLKNTPSTKNIQSGSREYEKISNQIIEHLKSLEGIKVLNWTCRYLGAVIYEKNRAALDEITCYDDVENDLLKATGNIIRKTPYYSLQYNSETKKMIPSKIYNQDIIKFNGKVIKTIGHEIGQALILVEVDSIFIDTSK